MKIIKNPMEIYEEYLAMIEKQIGNKTTSSDTINKAGKYLFGDKFLGVFARDEVPEFKEGESLIFNLDKRGMRGSHWCALTRLEDGQILFYDSFGRPSKSLGISGGAGGEKIDEDPEFDSEQDVEETNCGQRSLAFLCVLTTQGEKAARMI